MQSYYVGLDVHSRESVFVVENEAGVIVARGALTHDFCYRVGGGCLR